MLYLPTQGRTREHLLDASVEFLSQHGTLLTALSRVGKLVELSWEIYF